MEVNSAEQSTTTEQPTRFNNDVEDFNAVLYVEQRKIFVFGTSCHRYPQAYLVPLPPTDTTLEILLMVGSNDPLTIDPRAFVLELGFSSDVLKIKPGGVWVSADAGAVVRRIRKQAEPVGSPPIG